MPYLWKKQRQKVIVEKVNYAELFNAIRRTIFIRNQGILFAVLFRKRKFGFVYQPYFSI